MKTIVEQYTNYTSAFELQYYRTVNSGCAENRAWMISILEVLATFHTSVCVLKRRPWPTDV